MNIVYRKHIPQGALIKDCFSVTLVDLIDRRLDDHFILFVLDDALRVSCWSFPRSSPMSPVASPISPSSYAVGSSETYDIAVKPVFGRVLQCRVVREKVFLTSDSGTFSIVQVKPIETQSTANGTKVVRACFDVVFQTTIAGLQAQSFVDLGFSLAIDPSCRSFVIGSFQSRASLFSLGGSFCRLEETYKDLGIVWDCVYLFSMTNAPLSQKFILLHTTPCETQMCLSLFSNAVQLKSPYLFPKGHVPLFIVALPDIPESFLVFTNNSVIFFDTHATADCLEATRYSFLDFPNNDGNQEILIVDFAIDFQRSKVGVQYMYLVSERGDIFLGTITWTPLTISFGHIGQCSHPVERCLLLPNSRNSYLACFGSLCEGSVMLIFENRHALSLDPPFPLPNSIPVSDCFSYTPRNDESPGLKGIIGDCLLTMSEGKNNGVLTRSTHGINAWIKSKYCNLDNAITGMFSITVEGMFLIIISFVFETRVFRFLEPALTDFTTESGLLDYLPTVCVFELDGGILQITKSGMNVSLFSLEDSWFSFSKSFDLGMEGEILASAIHENYVFLAFKNKLVIFKLLLDPSSLVVSFVKLHTGEFSEQISTLYICSTNELVPFPLCFVGTSQKVKIFSVPLLIQSGSCTTWREVEIRNNSADTCMMNSAALSFDTPQSISLLFSDSNSYLLCSTSNGNLFVFDWEVLENDVYIGSPSIFPSMSEYPIFFSHHPLSDYLLATTSDRSPFKISAGPFGVEFEPILLDRATFISHLPLHCCYLMSLTNKMLAVVHIDVRAQTLKETFQQKNIPRKMVFDAATNNFLVVASSRSDASGTAKSFLTLLDPTNNQILAAKSISDHETVECLTVWNVKKKRYICIGTSAYRDSDSGSQNLGRIVVFTTKQSKKGTDSVFKFYLLSELVVPQGVSAIAPAENYLFASFGSQLVQVKINAETRHIMIGAKCSSRNPAKAIKATRDFDLFLAGSQDSLCCFSFLKDEKKIRLIGADPIPKQAIDCLVFGNDGDECKMAVCIFKSGAIAGYRCDRRRKLETLFHFSIQDVPVRIIPMTVEKDPSTLAGENSLNISVHLQSFDIPWDASSTGQTLVVVTRTNCRCTLLRISDEMFRLLKELQGIMMNFPSTKPILGGDINTLHSSKEYGYFTSSALNMDFLCQYLELNSAEKQAICSRFKSSFRFKDAATHLSSPGEKSIANVYLGFKEIDCILYRLSKKLI